MEGGREAVINSRKRDTERTRGKSRGTYDTALTAFRLDSQLQRKLHSHVARESREAADKSGALITFSRGFAGEWTSWNENMAPWAITKENAGKCNENSYAVISESIRVFAISILRAYSLQICLVKSLGIGLCYRTARVSFICRSIDQLSERRYATYLSVANDANSSWMKL